MLVRAIALLSAFAAIVVVLEGCGGGGDVTTSTITTTTITTVTTTTSTTTTTTNDGECVGNDLDTMSTHHSMAVPCFCMYTHQCEDFPKLAECKGLTEQAYEECQIKVCGGYTLDLTPWTASFKNHKDADDILTIPTQWFDHITQMIGDCKRPYDLMLNMLKDGRRVYAKQLGKSGGPPQFQCVHLEARVDVHWLHLHSFNGSVPGEGLPGVYPNATCVPVTSNVEQDTKDMLKKVNPPGGGSKNNMIDIVI